MKRLYTSTTSTKRGAVYREFSSCPDGSAGSGSAQNCAVCISSDPVAVIDPVGCDAFALNNSNNYARLPSRYAADKEIDTLGYDDRWSAISNPFTPPDPNCPIPPLTLLYPDLWSLAGGVSQALQEDALEDSCYCPGTGIETPSLSIGRPRFPSINTVPFFAFPNFQSSFSAGSGIVTSVRSFNADGPSLDTGCCPTDDDVPDHIEAEIVDGELRITRREKRPIKEAYRADDTDKSFQIVAGYPKNCCLLDDCSPSGTDEFVNRELHFPRWPSPNSIVENIDAAGNLSQRSARDPYNADEAQRTEPLGLIPVVVDVQCHDDGKLYIYYANIIVHDGIICGLKWNTSAPRIDSLAGNIPPVAPETLSVNRDYQDNPIWANIQGTGPYTYLEDFTPIAEQNINKPWCKETCNEAAVAMNKSADACTAACPAEVLMCSEPGHSQFISEEYGLTAAQAEANALNSAQGADTATYCTGDTSSIEYWICYTVFDESAQMYKSAVAFCCDPA